MERGKRFWEESEMTDRYSPAPNSVDSGFESGPCSPDSSSCSSSVVDSSAVQLSRNEPPTKIRRYGAKIGTEKLSENKPERESFVDEEAKDDVSSTAESGSARSVPSSSPEPQPEQAHQPEEPSTSADEYEPRTSAGFNCLWAGCQQSYGDVNDLYDHAVQEHLSIIPLQNISNGTKRRNSEASEKRFQCQWRGCEMTLKRGSADKKLEWLSSHFRARHAPRAQPFKCLLEDCTIRFQTQKALHAHLRNSHDDKPGKKCQNIRIEKSSCFTYKPPTRSTDYGLLDFMDDRTYQHIANRLEDMFGALEKSSPALVGTPCIPKHKTISLLSQIFPHKF
ncbi:unnamed protein product [Bursaphelenchus xylophilus]|uniref:(pine wood nematode) hypothetical protein n=1 Tax=Bursaphelenchus xylophilus TaxID=6326 RepID=A0A1I7SWC7_BURXY|nr:unnamed protein product [Bursaphelenchus xylophilus]CAG9099201.1 unnamed protein product [Bursaphelenchus xylophilus]